MGDDDGKVVDLPVVNNRQLTAKQEKFAQMVANGSTKSEAYRSCYNVSNMKPESIYSEAVKTAANPIVAQRISDIVDSIQSKMMADSVRIRRHVVKRLYEESIDRDEGTASTRLKALELLGRMDIVDMFSRKAESSAEQRSAEEIAKELRNKIRDMMR